MSDRHLLQARWSQHQPLSLIQSSKLLINHIRCNSTEMKYRLPFYILLSIHLTLGWSLCLVTVVLESFSSGMVSTCPMSLAIFTKCSLIPLNQCTHLVRFQYSVPLSQITILLTLPLLLLLNKGFTVFQKIFPLPSQFLAK